MPFNINTGTYTSVAGATTAATGQVIQSAVWNSIHGDLAIAITDIGQLQVATPAQRNIIEPNGSFEIWQRGTVVTVSASSTVYTADRWYVAAGANQGHTVSAVAGLVNGSRLAAKVQRAQSQTGTVALAFGYPLDSDSVAQVSGQFVALSFTAKAGAAFSPTSGQLVANVYTGTGTVVQKQVVGFTGQALAINATVALTSSPTKYTFISGSIVPAVVTTQCEVQFQWTPTGTAGADDSFTIDDVEFTPVPTASGPQLPIWRPNFAVSLMECQRYYEKTFPYTVAPAQNVGTVGALACLTAVVSDAPSVDWQFKVSKRATPTITTFNPGAGNANWRNITDGADVTVTVDTANTNSPERVLIYGATVAGASKIIVIHAAADAGI